MDDRLVFADDRLAVTTNARDYVELLLKVLVALLVVEQLVELLHERRLLLQIAALVVRERSSAYKNQTELDFVALHHELVHLEAVAILASATQNLDQEREQHGVVNRQLQLDVAKMSGTVLFVRTRKKAHIEGAVARGALDVEVHGAQSRIVETATE